MVLEKNAENTLNRACKQKEILRKIQRKREIIKLLLLSSLKDS